MKRKRRIRTQEIYKWKAQLNVHGEQMVQSLHYWETFSLVVTWAAIQMILILSIIHDWHTCQVDFVLAYPQADPETDLYMNIPRSFKCKGKTDKKSHVLKLLKNLYGDKASRRNWNQHFYKNLIKLGWKQSEVDDCVYYKNQTIFFVYVDNRIFAGPDERQIEQYF